MGKADERHQITSERYKARIGLHYTSLMRSSGLYKDEDEILRLERTLRNLALDKKTRREMKKLYEKKLKAFRPKEQKVAEEATRLTLMDINNQREEDK